MTGIRIYVDGASKGNPGPSGIGVVISRDGKVLKEIASFIGNTTNNVAEYTALIYALEEGLILKAENIEINTDSQLLYRQIKKIYKVKSGNIIGLHNQALHLMSAFKSVSIKHIPREQNRDADKLASKAVKEALCK
jgi:ribonuclease HI